MQPIMPSLCPRLAPLEVQAASYFAASARMVSFWSSSMAYPSRGAAGPFQSGAVYFNGRKVQ